jgi:hypothetical protein
MTFLSFKLYKLFVLCVPSLIMFRHGSQKALISKRQSGWTWDRKNTKRVVGNVDLGFRRHQLDYALSALLLDVDAMSLVDGLKALKLVFFDDLRKENENPFWPSVDTDEDQTQTITGSASLYGTTVAYR